MLSKVVVARPGAGQTAATLARRAWRPPRPTLLGQFVLANAAVCLALALILGTWVGQEIELGVLNRTATITALYVDSVVTPLVQPVDGRLVLDQSQVATLDRLVAGPLRHERIVAVKVWSLDGRILYSPDTRLIGQSFSVDEGLARAGRGEVTAGITDLEDPENVYERERWRRLLQVYSPIREDRGGQIVGVAEFYQLPDDLEVEIASAQRRSWAVVGALTLAVFVLLVGIVKRGNDTITRQQGALRAQVAELAGLHERVRGAAARTTALNEQALRRVSADLHDGPGQALALALLRLDADRPASGERPAGDYQTIHSAVRDALSDIRVISRGLRLPELGALSPADVARRVVVDHERRTGTGVALEIEPVPGRAGLSTKIALHRTLQETLSNATRHGEGRDVTVRLREGGGMLELIVADGGPGFDPGAPPGSGLGLAGMRERAEMLGGTFAVRSSPRAGTSVEVRLPLAAENDE